MLNVAIELSNAAAEWLGNKGYDSTMGARPLSRVIQEQIKKPLADELLFGKLAKGGLVKIGIKNNEIDLQIIERGFFQRFSQIFSLSIAQS